MANVIDDIEILANLPEPRKEMPVFTVRNASLRERQGAIDLFGNRLDLGKFKVAEIEESLHFFSGKGEIQYYRPSGALWARNESVGEAFDNEIRPWSGLVKSGDEKDPRLILPDETNKELVAQAQAIMEEGNLSSKHIFLDGVNLEQIAVLNPDGEEIGPKAGEAVARFLYRVEDVIVDGAGAKSYFYFNPGDDKPSLVGAFHAWREIVDAKAVKMPEPEEMLRVALTMDPEISLYQERRQSIKLRAIELIYFTFPAFMHQELVFPALRVVGSIVMEEEKGKHGFEFARFFHAVPTEEYARADLFASYLAKPL